MITGIVLCHPQSKDYIRKSMLHSDYVKSIRIACGTSKPKNVDLYEASDFSPSYASLNAALFETSIILTVWEHADTLIGDNDMAFLHTDVKINYKAKKTWNYVNNLLNDGTTVGLTINAAYEGLIDDLAIPSDMPFDVKRDPMRLHAFDHGIFVWDYIKKYDNDIFEYAMDTNPRMIYSHQFACKRRVFDMLGDKLYSIVRKLRMGDVGLWTPHMFERLIALYLSKYSETVLTSAFWHYSSSGTYGPGEMTLYGPRPFKYYRTSTRYNTTECNPVEEPKSKLLRIRRKTVLDHL